MKGAFICLYGINNIGKSTQAKHLVAYLKEKGLSVHYVKYPLYDLAPSGPYLNTILRSGKTQPISEEELQLWYTINRFQNDAVLRSAVEDDMCVVAEDYIGTGLAWGITKGVNEDWLVAMNSPLLKEDIAILLDGERFLAGKEATHLHETDEDLMRRCRETHRALGRRHGWKAVDANQGEEAVAGAIGSIVDDFLESR